MLFVSGESRCVLCEKTLDAADDVFVVSEFVKPEKMLEPESGFYHFDCFYGLDSKQAYLSVEEADLRRSISDPESPLDVVKSSNNYCLVYLYAGKVHRFHFCKKAREIRFLSPDDWLSFKSLVLGLQKEDLIGGTVLSAEVSKEQYPYSISIENDTVNLFESQEVEKEIELRLADYNMLLEKKESESLPVDEVIDFERLFFDHKIRPVYVDGLLSRCKGRVVRTEEMGENVIIYIKVERLMRIPLSLLEFEMLQKFLSGTNGEARDRSQDK